jgi:hypothetical protein
VPPDLPRNAAALLLQLAFRQLIKEPNVEAAFERVSALTDQPIEYEAFCEAVETCLREGLIREPIRLPEGALHCHWRLELTPKGVAHVRSLPRRIAV